MPLDSTTYQETKTRDPLTLESFIAWLEQQPSTAEYYWPDPNQCIFCQYGKAVGFSYLEVVDGMRRTLGMPSSGAPLEPGGIGIEYPHTYGAALDRARAFLSAQR